MTKISSWEIYQCHILSQWMAFLQWRLCWRQMSVYHQGWCVSIYTDSPSLQWRLLVQLQIGLHWDATGAIAPLNKTFQNWTVAHLMVLQEADYDWIISKFDDEPWIAATLTVISRKYWWHNSPEVSLWSKSVVWTKFHSRGSFVTKLLRTLLAKMCQSQKQIFP